MEITNKKKNHALENSISNLNQALEMGLSSEEYNLICKKLQRTPNFTETGIFAAMFSEHWHSCSEG